MNAAYALRTSRFNNGVPTHRADGMYIRPDGRMTDHPPSALIFDTVDGAEKYIIWWRIESDVESAHGIPLFIVEVETIRKVKRQLRVVK